MSKRLILVIGQKGGTGKSTASRAILDRLRRDGIPTAAYDGDGADVGQFYQFYAAKNSAGDLVDPQDPLTGVVAYDVRHPRERDALLNSLATGADVIIHDLPGGSLLPLLSITGSADALVDQVGRYGYRVTLIIVLSPAFASALITGDIVAAFGTAVDYVAIKNLALGLDEDFRIFDGYVDGEGAKGGKGKAALLASGGRIITMPRTLLEAGTYWLIDLYDLPFAAATDDPRLTISDRSRSHGFVTEFDRQLSTVGPFLGLR